ncbi:MAG: hypothetical protein IJX02_02395 [Clostridia bacterium]|nr:hypothetical protein [Clostridia bacterium]
MKKYIKPEYDNNNQLADVVLLSVQKDEVNNKITGIIDIEDLFGTSTKEI